MRREAFVVMHCFAIGSKLAISGIKSSSKAPLFYVAHLGHFVSVIGTD